MHTRTMVELVDASSLWRCFVGLLQLSIVSCMSRGVDVCMLCGDVALDVLV